jgi:hypothetical protein
MAVVGCRHKTDVGPVLRNARSQGQSEQHLLATSFCEIAESIRDFLK